MDYKFETWPIDNLIEYARNPRKNDHAVDKVASAIREFGFRVPIVAKSDGTVVDVMMGVLMFFNIIYSFAEVEFGLTEGSIY